MVIGKAPLQGKLVDVNKGDFENPANTKSSDFFSPTPPLEALRLFLSHATDGEVDMPLENPRRKAHPHAFGRTRGASAASVRTTETKSLWHSKRTAR